MLNTPHIFASFLSAPLSVILLLHSLDFSICMLNFLFLLRMHAFTASHVSIVIRILHRHQFACLNHCCGGLICCDCLHKWVVLKTSPSPFILMSSSSIVCMPTFFLVFYFSFSSFSIINVSIRTWFRVWYYTPSVPFIILRMSWIWGQEKRRKVVINVRLRGGTEGVAHNSEEIKQFFFF